MGTKTHCRIKLPLLLLLHRHQEILSDQTNPPSLITWAQRCIVISNSMYTGRCAPRHTFRSTPPLSFYSEHIHHMYCVQTHMCTYVYVRTNAHVCLYVRGRIVRAQSNGLFSQWQQKVEGENLRGAAPYNCKTWSISNSFSAAPDVVSGGLI